jgi:hypothetical protein
MGRTTEAQPHKAPSPPQKAPKKKQAVPKPDGMGGMGLCQSKKRKKKKRLTQKLKSGQGLSWPRKLDATVTWHRYSKEPTVL